MPRLRLRIALLVLPAVLAGCSASGPFPELHELTGTVTRDGQPVVGGGLLFTPDPPSPSGLIVHAAVREDGMFAAETTFPGDRGRVSRPGAPAGHYRVVYQPLTDGLETNLEVKLDQRVEVEPGGKPVSLTVPAKPAPGARPDRASAPAATK